MGRIMDIKRKLKRLNRKSTITEEQKNKIVEYKQILKEWKAK